MGKMLNKPPRAARAPRHPTLERGEPVWDIARFFPEQGEWSEAEYLALEGNKLVEFSDGFLEVLPMPTTAHQRVVLFLVGLLATFAAPRKLGEALIAPLRVRLWRRTYRQPDVIFMRSQNAARVHEAFWDGADLVMEVVSDGSSDRHRDLVKKRGEYARAKIPEYWLIDRRERQITVLKLKGTRYAVHGVFGEGMRATSALLKGFEVEVDDVLAAAAG